MCFFGKNTKKSNVARISLGYFDLIQGMGIILDVPKEEIVFSLSDFKILAREKISKEGSSELALFLLLDEFILEGNYLTVYFSPYCISNWSKSDFEIKKDRKKYKTVVNLLKRELKNKNEEALLVWDLIFSLFDPSDKQKRINKIKSVFNEVRVRESGCFTYHILSLLKKWLMNERRDDAHALGLKLAEVCFLSFDTLLSECAQENNLI